MNILHRQMQQVNNALSLIKDYEPFLDSDGKQICTTLADGVVLEWRNIALVPLFYSTTVNGLTYSKNEQDNTITHIEGISSQKYSQLGVRKGNMIALHSYVVRPIIKYNIEGNNEGGVAINNSGYIALELKNSYLTFTAKTDNIYIAFLVTANNKEVNCDIQMNLIDLTALFTHHPNLLPTDAAAFKAMFWSEGTEGTESDKQLGYTAYSAEAESVIVYKGKLYKMSV